MSKVKLTCSIVGRDMSGNYQYIVEDDSHIVVSKGVSSSLGFVKHDAGGYHTKDEFDEQYGKGNWEVAYSFDENNEIPVAVMR